MQYLGSILDLICHVNHLPVEDLNADSSTKPYLSVPSYLWPPLYDIVVPGLTLAQNLLQPTL